MPYAACPFIAVDIGNTRLKFGRFDASAADPLPQPQSTIGLVANELDRLEGWLPCPPSEATWFIASVQRAFCTQLVDWLHRRGAAERIVLLTSRDLPLLIELARPDMVGIDRLVGAVAANKLRVPGRPAAVVDLGTAITVDWVSAAGAFCGGAILPGIGMSARAMHQFTDLLPLIAMEELTEPPAVLGTNTVAAMQSGLFWGAIGGVREIIARLAGPAPAAPPQVFLTGGAAPAVAKLIASDATYVPHLTLQGIALTVATMRARAA
jgi:type III pantothenate kinase